MSKTPLAHEHHIVPVWVYVLNLVALTGLMLLTVAMSYVNLPGIGPISGTAVNNIVAMAIAGIKVLLVVIIFMHVRWATKLTKFWVSAGFVAYILMTFTYGDYATRHLEPAPSWEGTPDSALPRNYGSGQGAIKDETTINVRPRQ